MNKLINTYTQGESIIEQYVTGRFIADGATYCIIESFRDGAWTDTTNELEG